MRTLLLFIASCACFPLIASAQPVCPAAPVANLNSTPNWNGWSPDLNNSRYQPAAGAGITSAQAPNLKLKWAFGLPNVKSILGQPTIAAGRLYLGVDTGYVYSLDAKTGCQFWSYRAATGVRTAVTVGPAGPNRTAAFFGDMLGAAYAVDASTGDLLWKVQLDPHPRARISGAPTLYDGRLYVPVASQEEAAAADPNYGCCVFRGSVVALEAATGKLIWQTYAIAQAPKPTRKISTGVQLYGPSGAGIWGALTIDAKRGLLYAATGDGYSEPDVKTTDAILAFSLATGKMVWSIQDTESDTFVVGCRGDKKHEACPEELGPDYDFGSSPMLRTAPGGRDMLVIGQKSGIIWAHDPDRKGAVIWKHSTADKPVGPGGQIVWGGAADDRRAYFGLNSGGVVAVQLKDGARAWLTPLSPPTGREKNPGQDGATTAAGDLVYTGGWDGVLHVLSAESGKILWSFDTVRDYITVNGVAAKGGSLGGPGPVVAGGMLYVGSGFPGVKGGIAGNALLAFGVE